MALLHLDALPYAPTLAMTWPKCFFRAGSEGLTGSWPGPGLVIYSTPPGAHDRIRPAGHGRGAPAGRRRTGTPRACRGDLFAICSLPILVQLIETFAQGFQLSRYHFNLDSMILPAD